MLNYYVFWSNEDKEFVGICKEFPSLSFLSKTEEEALTGIIDTVELLNSIESILE